MGSHRSLWGHNKSQNKLTAALFLEHDDVKHTVLFGKKGVKEKLRAEIECLPTKIKGFKMSFKECETYLGQQFSSGGTSESITKTLMARRVKCTTKATDLAKKLEDPRIHALGWLITAVTVFKATIVPTLLYGCVAWGV